MKKIAHNNIKMLTK